MLEERSERGPMEEFERLLALSVPADQAPEELRADLRLAQQLKALNLSAESQVHERLRAQLAQQIRGGHAGRRGAARLPGHSRGWLGAMMAVLLILLVAGNLPARAALNRLFGRISASPSSPAPVQVNFPLTTSALPDPTLTLASHTPTFTGTAALPRHVTGESSAQSPTPAGAQAAPDHPEVVPTPQAPTRP